MIEREDDENSDDSDEIPLARSRSSLKRERVENETALSELVLDLLPLGAEKWQLLGLSEKTIETLSAAGKMKTHAARGRHLRLIRATLRGTEWEGVRRNVDHLRAGYRLSAPETDEADSPVLVWTEHLLLHADPGLARFMEEFPHADRKRLRQLARQVNKLPKDKRIKARAQLESAVRVVLRAKVNDEP